MRWSASCSVNVPSTTDSVTFLRMVDDFLGNTSACSSSFVGTRCNLDKLMAAAILVNDFRAHLRGETGDSQVDLVRASSNTMWRIDLGRSMARQCSLGSQ